MRGEGGRQTLVGVAVGEQLQARRGDADGDHPAIGAFAGAGDEAAPFQAIDQAGHVRVMGDQAVADLAARQPGFAAAAEDAQDVVLGLGQVIGLEDLDGDPGQLVGGAQEIEIDFQQRREERLALLDVSGEAASHGLDDICLNDYLQVISYGGGVDHRRHGVGG